MLLNVETGQYHGLNPVAARMFAVVMEEEAVEPAVPRLAEEFGVETERIATDLGEFIRGLAERGLIVVRDAAPE